VKTRRRKTHTHGKIGHTLQAFSPNRYFSISSAYETVDKNHFYIFQNALKLTGAMWNFKNFPEGYTSNPFSRTWEGAGIERV